VIMVYRLPADSCGEFFCGLSTEKSRIPTGMHCFENTK
jgi:hypothetical protein